MVDRFNASGLSVNDFCARYQISTQSLYQWRRKLQTDRATVGAATAIAELLPVRIVPTQNAAAQRSSTTVRSQVQIVTPNGFIVRVDASVQPSQLAELLSVVESICDGGNDSC
jgi:transposase-like protein